MKEFISKTCIFLFIPFLLVVISLVGIKNIVEKKIEKESIIILGDSQTEYINLPKTYNHSIAGSPYFVQYSFVDKFKKAIQNKKVYISCNFHNFSNMYENRIVNDTLLPGWIQSQLDILNAYNLLDFKFCNELKVKKVQNNFNFIESVIIFENLVFPKEKINSNVQLLDTLGISKTIFRHWKDPKYLNHDTVQMLYLDKLIKLLIKNKNEVILLKMPLTSYYNKNVPLKFKNQLYHIRQINNIRLLDLDKELNISNKYSFFKDYGHLNLSGDYLVQSFFIKNELKQN